MDDIKFELSNQADCIKSLQDWAAQYQSKVTTVEAQLQRDNLQCHGLKPQGDSTIDCVKSFLRDALQIAAETVARMEIVWCFRIGKPDSTKIEYTRTIFG